MIGGDCYYRMTLPLLQFEYKDDDFIDRYCSIVHMPAGCAEKGVVDFHVSNNKVQLIINVTHWLMFDAVEFSKIFRDPEGNPLYPDRDHVKIHGHHAAIKKLKGSTSKTNRIFFVFEFSPNCVIENDTVYIETLKDGNEETLIPGFQLIKSTTGPNPQVFAHFEFLQHVDGHEADQPMEDEIMLVGEEDESTEEEEEEGKAEDVGQGAPRRSWLPSFW